MYTFIQNSLLKYTHKYILTTIITFVFNVVFIDICSDQLYKIQYIPGSVY